MKLNKALPIILLLAVTSCAGIQEYRPELLSNPKNESIYERDLQECRADAEKRVDIAINENRGRGAAIGMFGLLGGVVDKATTKDDYNTSPLDMIDQCLRDQGYKIPMKNRL